MCFFFPPFLQSSETWFLLFALESSNEAVCFSRGCDGNALTSPVAPRVTASPVCLSVRRPGGMPAELSELCRALQLLEDLVETTSPQHRALYQGQPSGTAELPR